MIPRSHTTKHIDDFLPVPLADEMYAYLASIESSFVQLRGRKCLPLGGKVTSSGLVVADDVPTWLNVVMDHIYEHLLAPLSLPRPNHGLINVYEPGEGIMPHEDGPAYTPYATILSSGSGSVFDFVDKSSDRTVRAQVYLPIGSVLLFTDEAYRDVFHQFRFSKTDNVAPPVFNVPPSPDRLGTAVLSNTHLVRGKRISITLRHVPVLPS